MNHQQDLASETAAYPTVTGIFDSHCHYADSRFDPDRQELMEALPKGGVWAALLAGNDVETSRMNAEWAGRYPYLYASAGVHPEDVENAPSGWESQIELLTQKEKVVAVGEIGLDYHYEGFSKERQKEAFLWQLDLARRRNLPVIVHCRDAVQDCMEILTQARPEGVMHCFSGSAETAREVVSLGMYISFTGVITFSNAKKACRAAEEVPLDRLLLETDAPYMAPVPCRGKRCDSRMIAFTAAKLAEIKGVGVQELVDQCRKNACRLFRIPQ